MSKSDEFNFYEALIVQLLRNESNYTDETREKVKNAIYAAYKTLKGQEFSGEIFTQYVLSVLPELDVDPIEFIFLVLNYWSLSVLEELSIVTGETKVEWQEPKSKYTKKTKFL